MAAESRDANLYAFTRVKHQIWNINIDRYRQPARVSLNMQNEYPKSPETSADDDHCMYSCERYSKIKMSTFSLLAYENHDQRMSTWERLTQYTYFLPTENWQNHTGPRNQMSNARSNVHFDRLTVNIEIYRRMHTKSVAHFARAQTLSCVTDGVFRVCMIGCQEYIDQLVTSHRRVHVMQPVLTAETCPMRSATALGLTFFIFHFRMQFHSEFESKHSIWRQFFHVPLPSLPRSLSLTTLPSALTDFLSFLRLCWNKTTQNKLLEFISSFPSLLLLLSLMKRRVSLSIFLETKFEVWKCDEEQDTKKITK